MNICFVLVGPAVPENIGAAARAINTMGFSELRLVNPANHLADPSKWLAHGSVDVLEKALVFHDFNEAIADLDFIIGTTAKNRSVKQDYYTPENAFKLIENKSNSISQVGIVFGREESGLTNEELSKCDIAATIPLSKPYPSVNLAQSVMIFAYVFSSLKQMGSSEKDVTDKARIYHELKMNAFQILQKLNIGEDTVLYRRMLERLATSNDDDARLLLSFAKKFNLRFE